MGADLLWYSEGDFEQQRKEFLSENGGVRLSAAQESSKVDLAPVVKPKRLRTAVLTAFAAAVLMRMATSARDAKRVHADSPRRERVAS